MMCGDRQQCSFCPSHQGCTEMFMLFLYVVSWLVIQLEETRALRASLKSTLHHDLQLSVTWWDKSGMFSWRLCDSTDKTLTRETGWSLLSLTSSWALPSPVTCDKTAACRRKEKKKTSPLQPHKHYMHLWLSLHLSPRKTVCDLRSGDLGLTT